MKLINAQATFVVENSLFIIIKEKDIFDRIYNVKDYSIKLQIKKVKGHTVPMYFFIYLKDKGTDEEFKINIRINEKILEKFSFYLDFAENVVFTDLSTGKMTKGYKINRFLKKQWLESIKALEEVYLLKKMLRNI